MNNHRVGFTVLILSILWVLAGCSVNAIDIPTPTSPPLTSPVSLISPTVSASAFEPAPVLASPHLEPTPTASPTPVATSTPVPTFVECACTATCTCGIDYIIIISVDGLRPDAIEQAETPILDALRAKGAYHPAAKSVLPSVTLVSHASMLGGMRPEKHGVDWNTYDPDYGLIEGPTLFSVAHDAGLSTAMVVGKPKFAHLVLPESVDHYIYAGSTDRQVVDKALRLIQNDMPRLMFIHLPDVDSAGHALGWMSVGQLLVVHFTDTLIGELVGALEAYGYLNQTLLIITADHGGSGFVHGSDSPEDMTIPWLAVGPGVPEDVVLQNAIVTYDTAATVLHALDLPLPAEWDGQPVLEIVGENAR